MKQAMVQVKKTYIPFSPFQDQNGYAGLFPHCTYITTIFIDYIDHIHPILDQCISALPAHIIKWDHSFKVPKYLMKLEGAVTFTALFTLVNEYEQIQFQAFVPTKSLAHIRTGLETMIKSLENHGHPLPILGFTDNVASDYTTFLQCIPSLGKNITAVQLDEFSDLPRLTLLSNVDVRVCSTETEIQQACSLILDHVNGQELLYVGFDMEWEFSTHQFASSLQRTALIQIALPTAVYLFQVFGLKRFPSSLLVILK